MPASFRQYRVRTNRYKSAVQPPQIDANHPFSRWIAHAFVFSVGFGVYDAVTGRFTRVTEASNMSVSGADSYQSIRRTGGASIANGYIDVTASAISPSFTIVSQFRSIHNGDPARGLLDDDNGSARKFQYRLDGTTSTNSYLNFIYFNTVGSAFSAGTTAGSIKEGKIHVGCGRILSNGTLDVFLDGVKGTTGTVTGTPATTNNTFRIFNRKTGASAFGGDIFLELIFNIGLSDDQIRNISDNPWQVFIPSSNYAYNRFKEGQGQTTRSSWMLGSSASVDVDSCYSKAIKTVTTSQPQCGVDIDWSSPLTKGLSACVLFINGYFFELTTKQIFQGFNGYTGATDSLNSLKTVGTHPGKAGWLSPTTSFLQIANPTQADSIVGPFSVFLEHGVGNGYRTPLLWSVQRSLNSIGFELFADDNIVANTAAIGINVGVSNTFTLGSGALGVNSENYMHRTGFSVTGSAYKGYVGGIKVSESSGTLLPSVNSNRRIGLNYDAGGRNGVASLSVAFVWNRVISDDEHFSIALNPWQIFKTVPRSIPVDNTPVKLWTPTIWTSKTRVSQPQTPLTTANDIRSWAMFNFALGKNPFNFGLNTSTRNLSWSESGSNSLVVSKEQVGVKNGSGGLQYGVNRSFDGFSPANSPMFCVLSITHGAYIDNGSSANAIFSYGEIDAASGFCALVNTSNQLAVKVGNTSLNGPTLVAGRTYNIVFGRNSSGTCWLWVNGTLVANGTGATAADSSVARILFLLRDYQTTRYYQGTIALFAIGSSNPFEFGSKYSLNPWQIFQPTKHRIYTGI